MGTPSHFLSTRQRQDEWMDAPGADPELIRRSLGFIRWINRLLGYTRQTLGHLERFSRNWKPGETIWMLDLGTGSADMPRAILRWAGRRGFDVRIVGLDLHAATLQVAGEERVQSSEDRGRGSGNRGQRSEVRGENLIAPLTSSLQPLTSDLSCLHLVRGDALNPPFADRSFDYVLTAMFLHHLDDDQAERVLRQMNRLARRGVVAADLLRHRKAYFWVTLFTLFANPMVRHDARVSVAQAFNPEEALRMRDRAGLGFAGYFRHFGHRFALAGER